MGYCHPRLISGPYAPIESFIIAFQYVIAMASLEDLEKRITLIEDRNRRVESDKAWETSLTRKIIVAVLTYFVIVLFFVFAGLPNPLYNSIVPTMAYLLSTLTLPYIKQTWMKNRKSA